MALAGALPQQSLAQELRFTIDCDPVLVETLTTVDPSAADVAAATTPAQDSNFAKRIDVSKNEDSCLLSALPSYVEGSIQLAITRKSLADEKFLLGSVDEAKQWYDAALDAISELAEMPPAARAASDFQLSLLDRDIKYRQRLLAVGADFWGSGYFNHPANPVKLLQELQENYDEFSTLIAEIEHYRARADNTAVDQATLRAVHSQSSSDEQAERWRSDQQAEVVENSILARQLLLQRLKDNQRRQQEIAAELSENRDTVAKLNSQLTNSVISAIASSAGISPDMVEAATSGGDLPEIALGLAFSEPSFRDAIGSLSPDVAGLIDVVAEIESVAGNIEDAKVALIHLQQGLHEQNITKLLQAGSFIWEKLPNDDRQRLLSAVEASVPLEELIDLVPENEALIEEISTVVIELVVSQRPWEDVTKDSLRRNGLLPAWELATVISQASDGQPLDQTVQAILAKALVQEVSQAGAGKTIDQAGEQLAELRALVGEVIPDYTSIARSVELLTAVERAVEHGSVTIEISQNELLVRAEEAVVKVPFLEAKTIINRQVNSQGLSSALIASSDGSARISVVDSMVSLGLTAAQKGGVPPEQALMALIQADAVSAGTLLELGQVTGADLRMQIEARPGLKSALNEAGATLLAAQAAAGDPAVLAAASPPARTKIQEAGLSVRRTDVAGTSAEEMVAQIILANAVPGGAIAVTVLNAAKLVGQIELAITKGRELYNEDNALMREQIHLADMIGSTSRAQGLAEYDQQIAEVRSAGAAAAGSEYLRGIFKASASITDSQAQARLRIPLAIYYAEQMRRSYDELNHALSLWIGSDGSPRGTIARLVEDDPQFLRFALDEDIQLYQWLVRDFEGERTDLRRLMTHWRQLIALTTDVCRRVGCSSDAAVLGPVKQTGPVRLSGLVGEGQWASFKRWAAAPSGPTFEFNILISPETEIIDPRLQLLRVVEVFLGIETEDGRVVDPKAATLRHPGVAYVSENQGNFFKEFYPSIEKNDLEWDEDVDVGQLKLRWARTADLSRRDFEGYGLYTVWQLTISQRDLREIPSEILINFAIQYKPERTGQPDEERTISFLASEPTIELKQGEQSVTELNGGSISLISSDFDPCSRIRVIYDVLSSTGERDDGASAINGITVPACRIIGSRNLDPTPR
ncbi:hypothetical protein [Paracoccus haeundaensis]|uniref:Uncharacterized protein n=1 Tax=Paracoccus haeundaensis TaxID=225362 RepID=A0A5C4RB24_9RHOB|nr:hypothetical protein [Paracoccus haeundaensis]TNH40947.1 hypothetical protein FHD67_02690 [Paracoccus haeundaensis]